MVRNTAGRGLGQRSLVGCWKAIWPDHEIMEWALNESRVVLTHDLDFGAMLAAIGASGPSVVQVRTHDVRPVGSLLSWSRCCGSSKLNLIPARLLVVDDGKSRVRLLPLVRRPPR